MKYIKTIIVLFSALLLFSCCAATNSQAIPAIHKIQASQIQQQWVLGGIDGQPIAIGVSSTLTISAANKATGNLACNYFFGTAQLQDNQLKIDKMGSTRRKCQKESDDVESIVSTILNNWSEVSVNADRMTLIGKSHRLNYKIKQQ